MLVFVVGDVHCPGPGAGRSVAARMSRAWVRRAVEADGHQVMTYPADTDLRTDDHDGDTVTLAPE